MNQPTLDPQPPARPQSPKRRWPEMLGGIVVALVVASGTGVGIMFMAGCSQTSNPPAASSSPPSTGSTVASAQKQVSASRLTSVVAEYHRDWSDTVSKVDTNCADPATVFACKI